MSRFLLSRALSAFATLILSSFAVCMLIHLIPGDPVVMMMAQNSSPTPEQIAMTTSWAIYGAVVQWRQQEQREPAKDFVQQVLPLIMAGLPSTTT